VTGETILVNTFIAVYLFLAWSWGEPSDSWMGRAIAPFSRAVLWLGLGQTWGMFAPDPAMIEGHLTARIVCEDGQTITWAPPRIADLPYGEAFLQFRYQKYEASLLDGDTAYLRPALAEHLMRLHADHHPVRVDLVYAEQAVPGPGADTTAEYPVTEQVFESYPEDEAAPFDDGPSGSADDPSMHADIEPDTTPRT